jgi:diaminopimelate epimerase
VRSELYKLEGAGNDFVLGVGAWVGRLDSEPDLVRRLCDRRRGIGADGTLSLESVAINRVRLGYRNADGGEAVFCANGTRCAARAAVDLLGCDPKIVIETGWADISAEVDGFRVSLELPPPETGPQHPEVNTPEGATGLCLMEVGVPHLVAAIEGLEDLDLEAVAPPLRHHAVLGSAGANVNLYEVAADGSARVRSYERGIEGETLSCGSGLVAVALVLMAERGTRDIELIPLSGDRLLVEALGEPPVCATRFTGPARFIAKLDPSEDLLRGF